MLQQQQIVGQYLKSKLYYWFELWRITCNLYNHFIVYYDYFLIFRSYIGITASWYDEDLQRNTSLLAIRRLEGSHTFEMLAKYMDNVYTEFEISDKIAYTTTDNGSNFVKSFK